MTKRNLAVAIIDILIWAVLIYLVLYPSDPFIRARTFWHTTKTCWAIAGWFGRRAIQAELRYNRELEKQR